jgi:hypothetical protein
MQTSEPGLSYKPHFRKKPHWSTVHAVLSKGEVLNCVHLDMNVKWAGNECWPRPFLISHKPCNRYMQMKNISTYLRYKKLFKIVQAIFGRISVGYVDSENRPFFLGGFSH